MKEVLKSFLFAIIGIAAFSSCANDDLEIHDPIEQFKKDSVAIRTFVLKEDGDFIRDENTGIWYSILEHKESSTPYTYKITDSIGIKRIKFTAKLLYEGRLLNGTIFDRSQDETGTTFDIETRLTNHYPIDANLIAARMYAFLPKKIDEINLGGLTTQGLQKGMKIRFITPSVWAYANSFNGLIPANSPLDFTVTILDITD